MPTPYGGHPEKLASLVYGSRMGNGGEATGEGYKFRGRGYIQLTGKDNYSAFTKSIGEDCVANPDLVSTKYPLGSVRWFFSHHLNEMSDKGPSH
jgi:putative chitinase